MARALCLSCRKAAVMCYCGSISSFASRPQFVILLHPKESRKAINTGRMAFLHLQNALLLTGTDFSDHPELNHILTDPNKRCFLVFPGEQAMDLKAMPREADTTYETVFIILDATWSMARKMFLHSTNLQKIPQVMFHPERPSQFFIRQQPQEFCYSTIETIHHIIETMGNHPEGEHHRLLACFQDMVRRQIEYEFQL